MWTVAMKVVLSLCMDFSDRNKIGKGEIRCDSEWQFLIINFGIDFESIAVSVKHYMQNQIQRGK